MSQSLPNYVRTARKNAGLSGRDLAFLLGQKSASCISSYESYGRTPTLKSAILLEVALGAPMAELFPTIYDDARVRILRQAEALLERLRSRPQSPSLLIRLKSLGKFVENANAPTVCR